MDVRAVLDHPLIGQRYFFPQQLGLPDGVPVPIDAGQLVCWQSAPPDGRPTLVHFHGNGELVHHWIQSPIADVCARAGFRLFLAEYRGYGASSGDPRLLTMLDDTPAILRAVGEDPSKIVVFGRSVGSIFAVDWVRRYPTTAALILESGIFDVHERLALRVRPHEVGAQDAATFKAICDTRFDHGAVLAQHASPSLILHAERDDLVDITHAERSAEAAQRATFVRFARGDHNSILAANLHEYTGALERFLRDVRA